MVANLDRFCDVCTAENIVSLARLQKIVELCITVRGFLLSRLPALNYTNTKIKRKVTLDA